MHEVTLTGNSIDDAVNGWAYNYTGFNFILMDIAFPEGQNQVGYSVGQSMTYNGDGVVIKTMDSGETWEQVSSGVFPGLQASSVPTLETGYAVGWEGYMIKTTDGGDTWEEITIENNIWELTDVEFYDEENGVVIGDETAWVTSDGGETWTAATGIAKVPYAVTYADETTLYAACNENYIYKSVNGGLTWTEIHSGFIGQLLLGVDFLDADFGVAVGDGGVILMTEDGGATWHEQFIGDNLFHGIHLWDQDTMHVVGTPDLIYKTTDGGETWTEEYQGYSAWKAYYNVVFTDNYTGFVCGGSNGIVLRKEGSDMLPSIGVDPVTISFEDTWVGESSTETLTVTNVGLATLEVTGITSTNAVFTVNAASFDVEPGNSVDVEVTFTPDDEGAFTGILQIESNDLLAGTIEVDLSGNGMMAYAQIAVDPAEIVFDTTLVGQTAEAMITITNNGNADLDVSAISTSDPVFSTDITSILLGPGQSEEITVTFAPDEVMWFEGLLTLESNDPLNPVVEIGLSGYGETTIGINQRLAEQVVIYPNPANDHIYLGNVTDCEVLIYSLGGELMIQERIAGNGDHRISIAGLSTGSYIVMIQPQNGERFTKKLEVIQ